MMDGPFLYFIVALIACLIGTIPFGPINLTVVKTTVDYNAARGTEVAVAASLIEIVQALIATCFGMIISNFLEANLLVKTAIGLVFIVLAVVIFTRKPKPKLQQDVEEKSFFMKGLVIAALNPQAVPFWIFALAAISQYFVFEYMGIHLVAFLAGVFVGKLIALYGFVVASAYLKTHLEQSSVLVNRILASVLLFIGVSQLWNAVPA
ncbi:MAG: LysE family transporter [Pseudomonadales bacterium]|nr:LysE family transporter [Pseudomonadales bacterium]